MAELVNLCTLTREFVLKEVSNIDMKFGGARGEHHDILAFLYKPKIFQNPIDPRYFNSPWRSINETQYNGEWVGNVWADGGALKEQPFATVLTRVPRYRSPEDKPIMIFAADPCYFQKLKTRLIKAKAIVELYTKRELAKYKWDGKNWKLRNDFLRPATKKEIEARVKFFESLKTKWPDKVAECDKAIRQIKAAKGLKMMKGGLFS